MTTSDDVLGAPTFFRQSEMFFGGDRLAQACAWPAPRPLDLGPLSPARPRG